MNDWLSQAVANARNGVILDTNVMLVFVLGHWKPEIIPSCKRTASYTPEDFRLLRSIVERVGKMVTTPHILTEVCNLADTLNRKHGCQIYEMLAGLLQGSKERRQEAVRLTGIPEFLRLGLADTSLIEASIKRHLVITDDAMCHAAIHFSGGLAINLNHLRSDEWLQG